MKKLRLINARTMRFDEHFARLVVVFEEIFAALKAGRDLRSTSCSYLVFDRPLTIEKEKIKLCFNLTEIPVCLATRRGLRPQFCFCRKIVH